MTVRLPPEQAEDLEAVAETDGVPVAEAVRQAITSHIASRRMAKDFQSRRHLWIGTDASSRSWLRASSVCATPRR
jgi:hypothetical protein